MNDFALNMTRRHFFGRSMNVMGAAALASLLGEKQGNAAEAGPPVRLHHPAKAKQVIYLHMVGGPPQMDLFDYKPQMKRFYNVDLPPSVRGNQRLTTMTSGQGRFPVAPSKFQFHRRGKCGMWMTELLPNFGQVADECVHPQHEHRSDQPRTGDLHDADRQSGRRSALPRLLGLIWSRFAQP